MRSTMAPWRDGGGNRTVLDAGVRSAVHHQPEGRCLCRGSPRESRATIRFNVWTLTLREDAVFQDGTPITAQSFKDYWEHGAKPENIVAWGGASLTLGRYRGLGRVASRRRYRVRGSHGSSTTRRWKSRRSIPLATWPLNMAAWHVGISKLDQVKADEDWGNSPDRRGTVQP